jgi:hypothetical protein
MHTMSLQASAPIGSLSLTASRNGGRVLHLSPEHVTYIGNGTAVGVDVKVSGLVQANASFADTAGGSADFVPGGQRLQVVAQNDNVAASLDLSNVPAHTEFSLDRTNLKTHLATSQSVNTASYYMARRPGGPIIEGTLASVPTTVDITGSLSSNAAAVTYRADLPLGDAQLLYSSDANPGDRSGTTVRVHGHTVPSQLDVSYDRSAKTIHMGANAPVGLLESTLSRNGAQAGKFSGDHLAFSGTSTTYAASAAIHGLTSVDADFHGGALDSSASVHVIPGGQSFVLNGALDNDRIYGKVSNLPATTSLTLHGLRDIVYDASAPISRLDAYKATVGTGPTFAGTVTNAPTHVDVSATLANPHYQFTYSGSSGADYVKGYYSNKYVDRSLDASDNFASGYVDHPPASATIDANSSAGELSYSASAAARGAGVTVKDLFARGLQLYATATTIPSQFSVSRTSNSASFVSGSQPLGTIAFRASNHGTPANRGGNHLYLRWSKQTGQFNISARATDVSNLSYSSDDDLLSVTGAVDLHGQPFAVDAQIDTPAFNSDTNNDEYRILARGTISDLPSSVTFSKSGNQVKYDASGNLDISNLEVDFGWIQALATMRTAPPARYGVSVLDGACASGPGCTPANNRGYPEAFCSIAQNECDAIRVRYNLDGMARHVAVDWGHPIKATVSGGLSPNQHEFQVRAVLTHVLKDILHTPLSVDLTQQGIVAGTDLDFGPFGVRHGTDSEGGGVTLDIETHHSRALGRLKANLCLGTYNSTDKTCTSGPTYTVGSYRYSNLRGTVDVSSVPGDLVVTSNSGGDDLHTLSLSSGIGSFDVHAYADTQHDSGNGWNSVGSPMARLRLTDIPASPASPITVSVTAPRRSGGGSGGGCFGTSPPSTNETQMSTPGFRLTTPAPGMSMSVTSDPNLMAFTSMSKCLQIVVTPLSLTVTGMGTELDGSWDSHNRQLAIDSFGGPTSDIMMTTALTVNVDINKTTGNIYWPPRPFDDWRMSASAHIGVTANFPALTLAVSNLTNVAVTATGEYLAYGVEGQYDTLALTAPGLSVSADVNVHLKLEHWPYWSWQPKYDKTFDILKGSTQDLIGHVSKVGRTGDTGVCVDVPTDIGPFSVDLQTDPAPEDLYQNGFTVYGSDGRQVASMIDPGRMTSDFRSPHPFVTGLVDVLIAKLQNPYDNGGLGLDVDYFVSCADR